MILVGIGNMKIYKGLITELNFPSNGILVFGSNTQGRHGKGMAKLALDKFGAIYGEARGLQGQSYAICTKDLTTEIHSSRTPLQIKMEIATLYLKAKNKYSDKEFYVAYQGKGENLNGYSPEQMAKMFAHASLKEPIPENIIFEKEFAKLVDKYSLTKDVVVIINGSRQFEDYNLLEEKCYEILTPFIKQGKEIIIREGEASGADRLAVKFALENNFKLQRYPANWKEGKGAGLKRNIDMIKGKDGDKAADVMIAFNMGTPGTSHAIRWMKENTVFTSVYEINC